MVEHLVANENVDSSNLFTRSIFPYIFSQLCRMESTPCLQQPVQAVRGIRICYIIKLIYGFIMNEINKEILIQSIESSNLAHTISLIKDGLPLEYVNQAFLDQTGYERDEVVGRNCNFLQGKNTSPESVEKIRQSIRDLKAIDIEILNYKKDGTPFWNRLRMAPVFDENGEVVAFIGIQSDVTHIREQERQESDRQKLEALGRVSANISHEIKNAIQPIKLMTEMLLDWKDLSEEQLKKCINILGENVQIADGITKEVLSFSGKNNAKVEKTSAIKLANEIASFINNLLTSRVDLDYVSEELNENACVNINQSHLYQIVLNLLNNAVYAMNEQGTLSLTAKARILDGDESLENNVNSGEYLSITIKDDGCGMDAETMKSIFEPFYSTKPVGEGTGLGLSISNNMVREWGGFIRAESEKNVATMFEILLPIE